MSAAGRFSEINPVVDKTIAIADRIQKSCEQLQQDQRDRLAESAAEGAAASSRAKWIAYLLVGICLAVSGVAVWAVRNIGGGTASWPASRRRSRAGGQCGVQVSSSSQSLAQGNSQTHVP